MYFLEPTSTLVEVLEENHQLIPVINRFGIKLGMGDKTINSICDNQKINVDFFLAILNTYLNEEYFPERKLQKFDVSLVLDYLKETDKSLVNGQLYNLEKHLNALRSTSDPANKQLELIEKLFFKFKKELIAEIEEGMMKGDSSLSLLTDLKNIIIKHISGNFNENLCYAVIFSMDSLQKDLQKHNRIRERILKPKIKELEDAGIDDWKQLIGNDKAIHIDTNQPLSLRELDVLRLIATGLLNKEIANKLNISLNTVLTHRKNITAKLGIKTVSGLTFYCITHGYILSDEIEF